MIWRALSAGLALIVALVAFPMLRHLRETPPPPPPVIRGSFSAPPDAFFDGDGAGLDAALTPDGEEVVFTAVSDGITHLWHQRLDQDRPSVLPGTEGAFLPAWKPGKQTIAFFADGQLKAYAFKDRSVSVLAAAPDPGGVAWRDDGSVLFVPNLRGPIKSLRNGSIEDATHLRNGDRAHLFPAIAGDAIVYLAEREGASRTVRYAWPEGETELTSSSSHAVLVDDSLIYVRDGVLVTQRFDRERRALSGRASVLAPDAGISRTGHGAFAAARDVLISAPSASAIRTIAWLDDNGQQTAVVEPGDYWQLRLSPDGRHIAVTATAPLVRALDILVVPLATPADAWPLSFSLGPDSDPVWMSSGDVVYRSQQTGGSLLVTRPLAPRKAPELVVPGSSPGDVASDWRNGTLLVHATSADTRLDVHAISGGKRRRVTNGAFNEWDARLSPDGRRIAYVSDQSGQPEVYVDAWPAGGTLVRVTFAGGRRPQWGPRDAETLFFMRGESVFSAKAAADGHRLAFSTPIVRVRARGLLDYAIAGGDRVLGVIAANDRAAVPAQLTVHWKTLLPPPPAN